METLEPTTVKSQAIAKKAYQAFFSPTQYEVKPRDREVLDHGTSDRVPFEGGELALTTWGESGPLVLLMHGWGGARAQMTSFVEPLLEAGYRVAAYDQPAHGGSNGTMTNLLEIAPTMDWVKDHVGIPEAIIAHSFGTLVTSYALANRGFPLPSRLVYLGSFNRLLDSLPRFQVQAGLPDAIMDGIRDMLYANFGRDVLDAIANESMTPEITVPALMFHDRADSVTPVEDSRAIAKAWRSARLIETEGLGHRGALQAADVHKQVVEFIKG